MQPIKPECGQCGWPCGEIVAGREWIEGLYKCDGCGGGFCEFCLDGHGCGEEPNREAREAARDQWLSRDAAQRGRLFLGLGILFVGMALGWLLGHYG